MAYSVSQEIASSVGHWSLLHIFAIGPAGEVVSRARLPGYATRPTVTTEGEARLLGSNGRRRWS